MRDFWNRARRSKTFWTGVGAIITTIGMYSGDLLSIEEAAAAIFAAVQSINIRDTLAKATQ